MLQNRLADLPLGPIRYFDRTGSTNTEAARWVDSGAPDLALVVADEQTGGKGRLGRRWFTPPGSALAFTLILRVGQAGSLSYRNITRLTALSALAVCEALQEPWGLPARIKWPNDVLAGGRKLAGALVEAHWQGDQLAAAILGIGINVAPPSVPPPEGLNFPATCVEDALGEISGEIQNVDRMDLLHAVLSRVLVWRPRLDSPEFLRAWEAALAFLGEWVFIDESFQESGEILDESTRREGRILGLASDGALRLRDRSGEEFLVQAGEVRIQKRKT